jgi:ABC-type cobalamin/Fe3+-siderophores transport system ATPase subunit
MKPDVKAISRIRVKNLFGTYNYVLAPSPKACNTDRLLILYGDNGSGKTTILRTIFHLLAPESGEGHKTSIAQTPFERFEVDLSSGDRIRAYRPANRLVGSYTMDLRLHSGGRARFEMKADKAGAVKRSDTSDAFLAKLGKLKVVLYFLSDDRTVQLSGVGESDSALPQAGFPEEWVLAQAEVLGQAVRSVRRAEAEMKAQQLLPQSLKRAETWIQSQAVRGSAQGESSVYSLYSDLLGRISKLPLADTPSKDAVLRVTGKRVAEIEARSKDYAKYGLLPEFNGQELLRILNSAPKSHLPILTNVISPYLESVEKKLEAMQYLQQQINSLVTTLNSFLTKKRILFEIHSGFQIRTDDDRQILPGMLSSGERHLLLLFCNTLVALQGPSIFIIDEPEISLNIKWQRRLLSSLLACAGTQPIQYIFATHSFELLSQFRHNTIKLEEKAEAQDGPKADA